MGEPLSFIKECRPDMNAFSSSCTRLGLISSSHSVLVSEISITDGACSEQKTDASNVFPVNETMCYMDCDIEARFTLVTDGKYYTQSSHGLLK